MFAAPCLFLGESILILQTISAAFEGPDASYSTNLAAGILAAAPCAPCAPNPRDLGCISANPNAGRTTNKRNYYLRVAFSFFVAAYLKGQQQLLGSCQSKDMYFHREMIKFEGSSSEKFLGFRFSPCYLFDFRMEVNVSFPSPAPVSSITGHIPAAVRVSLKSCLKKDEFWSESEPRATG